MEAVNPRAVGVPMPQVIKPTVGRIVLFYHWVEGLKTHELKPVPAIITDVLSDRTIDVTVFAPSSGVQCRRASLVQAGEAPPPRSHCTWMPYQQGQAAKTDATAADAETLRFERDAARNEVQIADGEIERLKRERDHVESIRKTDYCAMIAERDTLAAQLETRTAQRNELQADLLANTSDEACALACMVVSNPQGGLQKPGWQAQVNGLIRSLQAERNTYRAEALAGQKQIVAVAKERDAERAQVVRLQRDIVEAREILAAMKQQRDQAVRHGNVRDL